MSEKKNSSILAPEARGGAVAQAGFGFQESLAAARIIRWMRYDTFESCVRESHGDVEGRFFVPGQNSVREFIEYKDHELAPREFWAEIEHYFGLSLETGKTYRQFVLACRGLSPTLRPLGAALTRIQALMPFYDDAAEIEAASRAELDAIVKARYSGDLELSALVTFLLERVVLVAHNPDAQRYAETVFTQAMAENYPVYSGYPAGVAATVHRELSRLLASRISVPISRAEIAVILFEPLREEHYPAPGIRLLTLHEQTTEIDEYPVVCDWRRFFQVDDNQYPTMAEYHDAVIAPLESIREWLLRRGEDRRVRLVGHRRLSVGFGVGHQLPSSAGFILEMQQGSALWRTDAHGGLSYQFEVSVSEANKSQELVVGIGINRDVRDEVETFLSNSDLAFPWRCFLFGKAPFADAHEAMAAVQAIKNQLHAIAASNSITRIHLFIGCPAFLAVALGQRLNLHLPIAVYERIKPCVYQRVFDLA